MIDECVVHERHEKHEKYIAKGNRVVEHIILIRVIPVFSSSVNYYSYFNKTKCDRNAGFACQGRQSLHSSDNVIYYAN